MKKLFIISGGTGREWEVSLTSGENVLGMLQQSGVEHESMTVNKDGSWTYQNEALSEKEALSILKEKNALVFQLIHGTYGEDGSLVALLEENNISYIGSSSAVMELTIDKHRTEKILQENIIATTSSWVIRNSSELEGLQINFPAIVKPKNEGSSIALCKAKNMEELVGFLEKVGSQYGEMLVQDFVMGREFTCGVVELNGQNTSLAPTEVILTKGDMFDYEAKYTVGGSNEVTPADIDQTLTTKIQDLALQVHTVCGCKDISRTDMIMKEDGEIVVLEISTVPGMTKTSFIPAQLAASGYSAIDFIKGMMEKYS